MANRREVETLLALHRLMRRDARRFAERLESVTPDGAVGPDVSRWFEVFRNALTEHHEVEDQVLFPLLEEREPSLDGVREHLATQHSDLDRILHEVDQALGRTDLLAAASAARDLVGLLDDHIPAEEEYLVGAANRLDDADFKTVDAAASRMHPMGEALVAVAWMVDGFDEAERTNFYRWQPRYVRVLVALTRPLYRRRARAAGMAN